MSDIQALATQLQTKSGNVDSLAKAVTNHLRQLSESVTNSASHTTSLIRTSSVAAIDSLSVFTRQGRDSRDEALAEIIETPETAISVLGDSSEAALEDLRLSTRRGHDSLVITLAASPPCATQRCMRDSAVGTA